MRVEIVVDRSRDMNMGENSLFVEVNEWINVFWDIIGIKYCFIYWGYKNDEVFDI